MRGAIIGLGIGILVGFGLDDPEDRVETVTETETVEVEVPGPQVVRYERVPLPDSCIEMVEIINRVWPVMGEYSTAVAGSVANLNDAIAAISRRDPGRINEAITVAHQIDHTASGHIRTIGDNIDRLTELQSQCTVDTED